jgi:hypothetical protein
MKKNLLLFIMLFLLTDLGRSEDTTFYYLNLNKPRIDDVRVTVFPNPTAENFSVKVELDQNAEVEISVFNAIGKVIYFSKEAGNQGTYVKAILFDEQPAGIYFVNVKAGEIKSIERLIKIK